MSIFSSQGKNPVRSRFVCVLFNNTSSRFRRYSDTLFSMVKKVTNLLLKIVDGVKLDGLIAYLKMLTQNAFLVNQLKRSTTSRHKNSRIDKVGGIMLFGTPMSV